MARKNHDGPARLRSAIARSDRLLSRQGSRTALTRTQFSVLGAVARSSPQRAADLQAREGLNPSMLSRVIGALEADGLVRRTAAPDDARQVVVEITPAGSELHLEHQRERTSLIEAYAARLTPDQQKQLWDAVPLLEGLADHLQSRELVSR